MMKSRGKIACLILVLAMSINMLKGNDPIHIPPSNPMLKYMGRIDKSDSLAYSFAYPGIHIKYTYQGTSSTIELEDFASGYEEPNGDKEANYFNVFIDGEFDQILGLKKGRQLYHLGENLDEGMHTVELTKRTEGLVGKCTFFGIKLPHGGKLFNAEDFPIKKIEFIGNSITCGYGNEDPHKESPFLCSTENNFLAYSAITARLLNASYHITAYSGKGVAQNYDGIKEETMFDCFYRTFPDDPSIKWDFSLYIPDLVVINLGSNDFASQVDTSFFREQYLGLVEVVRSFYPKAKILCLNGPCLTDAMPNQSLSKSRLVITSIVKNLKVKGDSQIFFYELDQQTGEFGIGANWHPTVAQHEHNAAELTEFIKKELHW